MTVRDVLAELQRLPRDEELLAFEPGCEREVAALMWSTYHGVRL
jgi:hypothetical protein